MIDKQRIAAKEFAEKWQGKGYERGQSQTFWLELLQKVFLVEDPFSFIKFEEKVKMTNTGFIDGRIPKTKVLIEQKSLEIDLKKENSSPTDRCVPHFNKPRGTFLLCHYLIILVGLFLAISSHS